MLNFDPRHENGPQTSLYGLYVFMETVNNEGCLICPWNLNL